MLFFSHPTVHSIVRVFQTAVWKQCGGEHHLDVALQAASKAAEQSS